MRSVLLIDDNAEQLEELKRELSQRLNNEAEIVPWMPVREENPTQVFDAFIKDKDVRLVVTDYDLTETGPLGFFGSAVLDWCQLGAIPVGDFSRGHASSLAAEPNLFELRVPVASPQEAADYISEVYRGFVAIREAIDHNPDLLQKRSPSAVLAAVLGESGIESQLSQYGLRFGGAGSALVGRLAEESVGDGPGLNEKAELLTYIVGHLLVNGVLRFPGPIVGGQALAAYLAVDESAKVQYSALFEEARYSGPFSELDDFYWTHKIDEVLARYEERLDQAQEFESPGEQNRTLLEVALGGVDLPRRQDCPRCEGKNGGFLCPFTRKTVCQRADCSVTSSAWIPPGARLARFERSFYEEWAPILGM